jgi:hypothetical protein
MRIRKWILHRIRKPDTQRETKTDTKRVTGCVQNAIPSPDMKPPARSLLSGRPPKRKRTDAELHDLARVLGADWTQGDTVQTWIHQHEGKTGELSRMVEAGWLWEDIGKAMHLAGITYSTGQPIPSHTLRLKAYLSRNRERERYATEAARQAQPHSPSVASAAAPVAASASAAVARPAATSMRAEIEFDAAQAVGGSAPEEPAFRLVTLKDGQQPTRPQPPPTSLPQEPSTTTQVSDDDILRRVFGKL